MNAEHRRQEGALSQYFAETPTWGGRKIAILDDADFVLTSKEPIRF